MDATEKTLGVLDAFDQRSRLGDIAERAKLPKSTVHRTQAPCRARATVLLVSRARKFGSFFVGLSVISLVAFLFSTETKDVDVGEMDPAQREIVSATAVAEEPLLVTSRR